MEDKKLYVSAKKAYRVEAKFADFDGELSAWKETFYNMWRWQMTYDYAYSIKVDERRSSGVYFCAIIKTSFKDDVVDALETYGCKNVTVEDCLVASVDMYGFEKAFGDYAEAAEIDE